MAMMTTTKLSTAGAILFGAAILSGQGHPSHQITNGEITATVYLPDAKQGFYTTTRFDWSGAIGSLKYKGHDYYGIWYSKIADIYDFGYEGPNKDVITAGFTAMVGPAVSKAPPELFTAFRPKAKYERSVPYSVWVRTSPVMRNRACMANGAV